MKQKTSKPQAALGEMSVVYCFGLSLLPIVARPGLTKGLQAPITASVLCFPLGCTRGYGNLYWQSADGEMY